jgi:predicted DNA-binding mobile mystery protein A
MKSQITNELTLNQIDRRFESLRAMKEKSQVREGWIKFMRNALGMTINDLAKLLSLSRMRVMQAERGEIEGKLTIATLKKMAEAMDCELVYSFVPKKDIRTTIHDKAVEKATGIINSAELHMKLEDQNVSGNKKERIERLAKKLLDSGDIW